MIEARVMNREKCGGKTAAGKLTKRLICIFSVFTFPISEFTKQKVKIIS